ncbi:MAG: CBS domain-containing protein [Acidimicrobiales bacterium]
MRISDILATKGSDVATVVHRTKVSAAIDELTRRSIGALVVSDDGVHIDGIVSERDIVRRLAADRDGLLIEEVGSIMSSPVHTCSADDDVEAVMATMTNERVRHVPVVSDGRILGIVSIGDLVKSRIEELQRERQLLVDYITAR